RDVHGCDSGTDPDRVCPVVGEAVSVATRQRRRVTRASEVVVSDTLCQTSDSFLHTVTSEDRIRDHFPPQ
ncbi:hypothetical protein KIPB_017042, partial [Kipferlia bialata]